MEDLLEEIGKELGPSQSLETYQTLAKILGNLLQNPEEAKFRSLKKDNKVIAGKILRSNHAASLLLAIGFDDDGTAYVCPPDADLELVRTAHDLLECIVLSSEAEAPAPAPVAETVPDAKAAPVAPAPTAKPAVKAQPNNDAVLGVARKGRDEAEQKRVAQAEQLAEARAAQRAQYTENPQGPAYVPPAVPEAPASSGYREEVAAKKKKENTNDFKDRGKSEAEKNRAAMSLEEIRKAQKEKFKDFQNDPHAKEQEAYKQPAAVAGGGKVEEGWGSWIGGGMGMFGGGSSSNGAQPKRKPEPERRKPNIKGVGDLPKPIRQGG